MYIHIKGAEKAFLIIGYLKQMLKEKAQGGKDLCCLGPEKLNIFPVFGFILRLKALTSFEL